MGLNSSKISIQTQPQPPTIQHIAISPVKSRTIDRNQQRKIDKFNIKQQNERKTNVIHTNIINVHSTKTNARITYRSQRTSSLQSTAPIFNAVVDEPSNNNQSINSTPHTHMSTLDTEFNDIIDAFDF